ncbi:beta strand repeat-containing protein, partial [Variovorax sp. DT-64]|uniref:beta strand repeat-containing protein n=1 Tax=Variovorax sp. DT-64 TaxID=3396160 RepID=UPI003F1DDD7A
SNTGGGVIGAEPVPQTPVQPGTGTGSGDTGTSNPTTPDTGTGTGTAPGSGTGGATIASPSYVPTPGTITAAGSVLNDAGRMYAGGPIQLQTPQVDNNGGSLTTTSLAVSGPSFSNVGGSVNVAQGFSANVDRFDNTGGTLRAGSLQIASTGDLINTDGKLESNADASLSAGGSLDNTRGSASATGALTANANGAIDNTAGLLVANQGVAIGAQSLNNSQGSIQSATAGTRLTVAQQLLNAQGSIGGATDLAIQAGSLSSSGSLRGNNDSTIEVTGALVNDGSITSGRHTTITAGHLQGSSTSVLAAGTLADGKLGSAGDLRVTTTGALVANGTTLAAGDVTLQGASIDLSSGTTSATRIALTATQGNVITSAATITTSGTLRVTADSQASQTLVNQGGNLNAGQLNLSASNIANTQGGEIVQTGSGATTIASSGAIDNSGTIASNGAITIAAGSLNNQGGALRAAGTSDLSLTVAGLLDNSRQGELSAGGKLTLQAGSLVNDAGRITSARPLQHDDRVDQQRRRHHRCQRQHRPGRRQPGQQRGHRFRPGQRDGEHPRRGEQQSRHAGCQPRRHA